MLDTWKMCQPVLTVLPILTDVFAQGQYPRRFRSIKLSDKLQTAEYIKVNSMCERAGPDNKTSQVVKTFLIAAGLYMSALRHLNVPTLLGAPELRGCAEC